MKYLAIALFTLIVIGCMFCVGWYYALIGF